MTFSRGYACASVVALLLLAPRGAAAITIGFEDVTTGNRQVIADGYMGFVWNGRWDVESDAEFTSGYSNSTGTPFGNYGVFNEFGQVGLLNSAVDFDFTGAYMRSFSIQDTLWPGFSSTSVTIEGYNNGVFVDSVFALLSPTTYTWIQADLLGVDELRFIPSDNPRWWMLDEFTYNESQLEAVPEPGTLVLTGTAVGALLAWTRRRRNGR